MTALDQLKLVLWGRAEPIAASFNTFSTWSITGVAAMAALLAANVGDMGKLVANGFLKCSLLLLAISLVTGYIAKFIGWMIASSSEQSRAVQVMLTGEYGQRLFGQLSSEPKDIAQALSSPFLWPWSSIVRASFIKGMDDPLFAAKLLVKLNCVQMIALSLHALLAAAAIATLALGIN